MIVVLIVGCAAAAAAGSTGAVIRPDLSIGRIYLRESHLHVEQTLGRGVALPGGARFVLYQSGRVRLRVEYDRTDRVTDLETTSRSATLYGRPLSEGFRRFRRVLTRHGWHGFSCDGQQIYAHFRRGHGSTVLTWTHNQLSDLDISQNAAPGEGGAPTCGLGSPVHHP